MLADPVLPSARAFDDVSFNHVVAALLGAKHLRTTGRVSPAGNAKLLGLSVSGDTRVAAAADAFLVDDDIDDFLDTLQKLAIRS